MEPCVPSACVAAEEGGFVHCHLLWATPQVESSAALMSRARSSRTLPTSASTAPLRWAEILAPKASAGRTSGHAEDNMVLNQISLPHHEGSKHRQVFWKAECGQEKFQRQCILGRTSPQQNHTEVSWKSRSDMGALCHSLRREDREEETRKVRDTQKASIGHVPG